MAYRPQHTTAERHALAAYWSSRVRNWRPVLRELCPAAKLVRNRVPSATKKGPGRVPLSLVVETRRK